MPYISHCKDTMKDANIRWYGRLSVLFTFITCNSDARGAAKNNMVTTEHIKPKLDLAVSKLSTWCIYSNVIMRNIRHPKNWRITEV